MPRDGLAFAVVVGRNQDVFGRELANNGRHRFDVVFFFRNQRKRGCESVIDIDGFESVNRTYVSFGGNTVICVP